MTTKVSISKGPTNMVEINTLGSGEFFENLEVIFV